MMQKYKVIMEFTGHHEIEIEAETNEEAIQMVEEHSYPHTFSTNLYDSSVEECLPVRLEKDSNEIWVI
tara:strand:- start:859 stop:1062 length:204 start_codon:yes stop_codon:yes gene_type:complete